MNKEAIDRVIEQLEETWRAPLIAREATGDATGQAVNPRTMANLDCLGLGPSQRFYLGRKACYPIDSFIEFLKKRAHV